MPVPCIDPVLKINEYILLSRDGEEMIMHLETDVDEFLDLLLDLKETGFEYKFLTQVQFNKYRRHGVEGYSTKKKKD